MNGKVKMHASIRASMKSVRLFRRKGFTMVELLVVIAIIGILMTMSAGVLRDAGKGRSVDSGVDMLESLVREARATAQGNDTYTRLVIADDPKDQSSDSRHLRYMTVQMFRKNDNKNNGYDGTEVSQDGRWVSVSAGVMLPPGVFFSPHYSRALEWADGSGNSMIGQGSERLSGKGYTRVYYLEFDEKGRFVFPNADPLNPTRPQRLVLINGRLGSGRRAHDGVIPLELDDQNRPVGAKGIVVWPMGDVSLLRTTEQVFADVDATDIGSGGRANSFGEDSGSKRGERAAKKKPRTLSDGTKSLKAKKKN